MNTSTRAVEDDRRRRRPDGTDDVELLVEGQQLAGARIFEVHAGGTRRERVGGRARRVAVACLEIGGDRDVDRRGDALDDPQHLRDGRLLAVLPAEGAGDGGARRRDRATPGKRSEDPRARDVPRVRQNEQRRPAVQRAELVRARHAPSDMP
jgi:hypothetical protein